jgi:hypothetical protein
MTNGAQYVRAHMPDERANHPEIFSSRHLPENVCSVAGPLNDWGCFRHYGVSVQGIDHHPSGVAPDGLWRTWRGDENVPAMQRGMMASTTHLRLETRRTAQNAHQ